MIELEDANPVPRDRVEGWSQSAEGRATRARVESSGSLGRQRSSRPVRTVAVAAAVVFALVASVLVIRGASDTPTPTAARSVVDRLADGTWRRVDTPELGLIAPVTVSAGRDVIVWGRTLLENKGARYDPQRKTWRVLAPSPLRPRDDAHVVWTGRELLVWGGVDAFAHETPLFDGAAYRPDTDSWRVMSAGPTFSADGTTTTWTGRELIVTNGYIERCLSKKVTASSCYPDAASYDPATDTWETVPDPPVSLRGNSSIRATWTGRDVVYVVPSGTLAARAAVAFDPELRTWRSLEAPFATGTFGAVGLVRDGRTAASVSWNTHDLEWVRLTADARWERGGQDLTHPFICGVEVSPVPRGAAVRCDQRHLVGLDLTRGAWHRFPPAPGELPPSLAWGAHELFAFAGDQLLALEPAAK